MPSSRQHVAKTLGKRSTKSSSEGDLFPRGAAPTATPRVKRRTGEVLFHHPTKRPRLSRGELIADPSLPILRHGIILSHPHFTPGATVLALVRRADPKAVTLALPGGLRASADPDITLIPQEGEDVAKTWEVVSPGMLVRAAVLGIEEKIVNLSLSPEMINVGLRGKGIEIGVGVLGVVMSIEDHGYVLSFGSFVKVGGFLPFQEVQGELRKGAIIEVVVQGKVGKVVKVSARKDKVRKAIGWGGAGGVLEGTILKKGVGGGIVMCGGVKVEVDGMHWQGEEGACKVMVICKGEKVVGSLLKEVIRGGVRKAPDWKTGRILEKARVVAVRGGGVVMDCEGAVIFAHGSRVDNIEEFKEGMEIENGARVVSVSLFDGVINVDMRRSVLNRKALSLDEVVVGEVYECRIVSTTSLGSLIMALEGDSQLMGIVPAVHVADVAIGAKRLAKHPDYRVGATLNCRVLGVQPEKKRIYLAAKKSLLKPKYSILSDFEEAAAAFEKGETLFTGIVKRILPTGAVIVAFCNTLVGMVPVSELCLDLSEETKKLAVQVEELYPVGQTVHVRLMSLDVKNRRFRLSMNIQGELDKREHLTVGQIVDGVITAGDKQANQFKVSVKLPIETGNMNAMSAMESDERTVECSLAFHHVADVPGIAEQIVRRMNHVLEESSEKPLVLKGLMVLTIQGDVPILTAKQSLIDAVAKNLLPRNFDDVKRLVSEAKTLPKGKTVLRGYVKALLPKGVIVGFLGDSVGFARVSRVADHFVSDPARALKLNQSVFALIESIEEEKQRVSLSLRMSDVGIDGLRDDTLSMFRSLDYWRETLGIDDTEEHVSVGKVLDASVRATHTYGTSYSLNVGNANIVGVELNVEKAGSINVPTKGIGAKIGEESKETCENVKTNRVRVVDVDPFSGVVDVSSDNNVMAGSGKKSILQVGASFDAHVLLVKGAYLILSVAQPKGRSAIAFALAPTVADQLTISPGTSLNGIVLDKTLAKTRRNLVLVDWSTFRNSQNKTRRVQSQVGSEVSETISLLRKLKESPQNETLLRGRKIVAKVTQKFSQNVLVGVCKGVVGNLHLTNTASLTIAERDGHAIGILPPDLGLRFALPEVGTQLTEAYVAGIKKRAVLQHEGPVCIDIALSKERNEANKLVAGEKVLGVIKELSSAFNSAESEKSTSWTKVAINNNTIVGCRDVDCLSKGHLMDLKVGTLVLCLITRVGLDGKIWTCLSENGKDRNQRFSAIVRSVKPGVGVFAEVPWLARRNDMKGKHLGRIGMCDIANCFDEVSDKLSTLKAGDIIEVGMVTANQSEEDGNDQVALTLRSKDKKEDDKLLTSKSAALLKKGTKVRGFVKAINKKGCFVTIGRGVDAHVRLCDLADEFVRDLEDAFPLGKLVEGVIEHTKQVNQKTAISLIVRKRPRKTLTSPKARNLSEGSRVDGVITRVEQYGAILKLGEGVTALLHKKEADQDRVIRDSTKEWCVGQKLNAVVIKVDENGIKVGTKKCYFEAAGLDEDEAEEILVANAKAYHAAGLETNDVATVKKESDEDMLDLETVDVGDDGPYANGAVNDEEDEFMEPAETLTQQNRNVTPLEIEQGFSFETSDNLRSTGRDLEEVKSEDDHENERAEEKIQKERSSKDKREKKRQREAAETAIRLREEQLANNLDSPETAEDFERLLIGEPNSSVLWIRYMAFCISLSQVDKARSIAERAIETISLAEEIERVNVWISYLNLEARFGAANSRNETVSDELGVKRDAAVFRVFDRACQRVTDVKNFHLQAASALQSISSQLQEEILLRATRKFRTSKKVWIAAGEFKFTNSDRAGARRVLERALKNLEKRKHVLVISKFAQFEYKYGSPERGRTIFESLVGNFNKKLDLWSVYLDMEVGRCRKSTSQDKDTAIEYARSLFERCTTLDLSSKKMKFIFRKWLGFEKTYGSAKSRDVVKNKAREYVERSTSDISKKS